MNPAYQRAYIDADTLYVISEAGAFLADLRHRHPDPDTGRWYHHDLLHLLASLTLHAQTWMHLLIQDIHADDESPLTTDGTTTSSPASHPTRSDGATPTTNPPARPAPRCPAHRGASPIPPAMVTEHDATILNESAALHDGRPPP